MWNVEPELWFKLPISMKSVQKDESVDPPIEHVIAFNNLGVSSIIWAKIKIEE